MSDAALVYKAQVFYGERLKIEVGIKDIHPYGCDIHYRMISLQNQVEVAAVKTGILGFDYKTKKLQKLPDNFENYLKGQY